MNRFLRWLISKFPARKSYAEISSLIRNHEEETKKAAEVLDKAIAALDGETGWWTCKCKPSEKECKYVDHINTTP